MNITHAPMVRVRAGSATGRARAPLAAAIALAGGAAAQEPPFAEPPSEEPPPEETLPDLAPEPQLVFSGLVAAAYQLQRGSVPHEDGGAVTIRPSLDLALTDADHLHLTFGLAGGNGVNDVSAFASAPWAGDLEDDLEDVNGSGRDLLQTAWYRRAFDLGPDHEIAVTGGVVDSTEYLDANAFANDEFTQFMNEAFVDAPTAFLPSYDLGGAVEWSRGAWSAAGVVMRVSENDDGEDYVFAGVQLARRIDTPLGAGHYRAVLNWASDDFADAAGTGTEPLLAGTISVDQRLGPVLGVWARVGLQDDAAAVTWDTKLSAGLDVNGRLWGREQDNLGIAYAHLDGGSTDLTSAQVFEAYARFGLTEAIAVTFDVQHLRDDVAGAGTVDGWILGGRFVLQF